MVRNTYGGVAQIKKMRYSVQQVQAGNKPPPQDESWIAYNLRGIRIVCSDWAAIFLIFVPIGYFWPDMNAEIVFLVNFLAIIPNATVTFTVIEIIGSHIGTYGRLLDAFLGKVVEQVMCVQCMRAGLVQVLQGNLMGSLHWNLLLVLGMSMFVCGVQRTTAEFNPNAASAQMSCQIVASISIALPTMFRTISSEITDATVLKVSRILAFVVMIVYALFLYFHFGTHKDQFEEGDKKKKSLTNATAEQEAEDAMAMGVHAKEKPLMDWAPATALLILSMVTCGCSSQRLVNSIPEVSDKFGIPKAFIGVTLLPIIGNTAEHLAALACAREGEMDLVIDIAVGSATQIALFVIPGAVLWGWMFDMPFTMDFRNFDATVMLASTFLVAQVLQHGNTNWLHGVMLMTTYTLIAIISWFIPE